MKNPRALEEVIASDTYKIPTYVVTNEGIKDGDGLYIKFCKGSTNNEDIKRQEGVFTETLLQLALEYLQGVNVGDMKTVFTDNAILKIQEGLMWINERRVDREIRGVLGTYSK